MTIEEVTNTVRTWTCDDCGKGETDENVVEAWMWTHTLDKGAHYCEDCICSDCNGALVHRNGSVDGVCTNCLDNQQRELSRDYAAGLDLREASVVWVDWDMDRLCLKTGDEYVIVYLAYSSHIDIYMDVRLADEHELERGEEE